MDPAAGRLEGGANNTIPPRILVAFLLTTTPVCRTIKGWTTGTMRGLLRVLVVCTLARV